MTGIIRAANTNDVSMMVALSEEKRLMYQNYQPVFWRKAENSQEVQTPFLERQIEDERFICLVHEEDEIVTGFLIAAIVSSPPVYNPGGLTGSIDDFWVKQGKDWEGAGTALLNEAISRIKQRGAAQLVVVCGHEDQPKRAMLQAHGYTLASEWYVTPI